MNKGAFHACALSIAHTGILIRGAAGSGKTSLMLGLYERLHMHQVEVTLISDDYVLLKKHKGRLIARAPDTIHGKVEIRGYDIIDMKAGIDPVYIHLVIDISEQAHVPRMRIVERVEICDCKVECLRVPACHEERAVRIVTAWLKDNTDIDLPLIGSWRKFSIL